MGDNTDAAAVSPETLKWVAGRYPSGVVLLTVRDAQDDDLGTRDDLGMTATAFTSVSVDPPLVLIGVGEESYFTEVLGRQDEWAVTVLAHAQKHIAGRFAVPGRPSARVLLGGVAHHRGPRSDAMIVDGGVAALECRTHQLVPAGDHVLAIGEVTRVDYPVEPAGADGQPTPPLVHFRGSYHRLQG